MACAVLLARRLSACRQSRSAFRLTVKCLLPMTNLTVAMLGRPGSLAILLGTVPPNAFATKVLWQALRQFLLSV